MTTAISKTRLLRLATVATAIAATALLTSCGTRTDRTTTGSVTGSNDYRTAHPITLAEVQHTLDVPIGSGEHGMTTSLRDLIRGFAQDYNSLSKSTIAVAVPAGAANSGAAQRAKGEIREVLLQANVKSNRIVFTSYEPTNASASAPIMMSFVAVTAITGDCGQWPTDLFGPSIRDNTNWENFGCASQQNLAAQIANPADLVGPRGMTPIDAQRRAQVISVYRKSGNPVP